MTNYEKQMELWANTVSIKTNYKTNRRVQKCLLQSTVNDQMEETLSKGLTEATLKEHRMQ